MIGVMGALDEEVELIHKLLENEKQKQKAGIRFLSGKLGGADVTVARCGVGKVNAAICAQIMIDTFSCERIIFAGVAGSLLTGLKQGDVVISSHAVQFDIDLTAFGRRHGELADRNRLIEADPVMVRAAFSAFDELTHDRDDPPSVMAGTIVSGDSFISDPDTIKWLQREFGAACTEMEGASVGYTSSINQVPFVIIRVISDSAGDGAAYEFDLFLAQSSKLLSDLVAGTVRRIS